MRIIKIVISILILIYGFYLLIACLNQIGSITNYGKGVLTGSLVIIVSGLLMFYFSIKKPKK